MLIDSNKTVITDQRFDSDESNTRFTNHVFVRLVAMGRIFTKVNFRYTCKPARRLGVLGHRLGLPPLRCCSPTTILAESWSMPAAPAPASTPPSFNGCGESCSRSRPIQCRSTCRRRAPAASAHPEEVRFAADSPLEGGVSCELVSENAKFPASREFYREFHRFGPSAAPRRQRKRS